MKLISITGPESTGKSSLAEALAKHYHTVWVREYAREYLEHLGRPYVYEDILKIAESQLKHEEEMATKAGDFLFCDTDMLVCRIWSEFKFGKVDPWLDSLVKEHPYDLYLLCDVDLPWVEDPLREHPDRRRELFDLYFYALEQLHLPFEVVSGEGWQRTAHAISAIEKTFKGKSFKTRNEISGS